MTEPSISDRQRRVLEAAMDVFAERGYSAASTSEIAQRAGVAAGTVFRFYQTKKDLLIGVVTPLFRRFVAPQFVGPIREQLTAEWGALDEFLLSFFRDRLDFARKHKRAVRIALQETPLHAELRSSWQDSVAAELWPLAIEAVRRMQVQGLIRPMDPALAARTILAVLAGFLLRRTLVEALDDEEADLHGSVDILVRGLGA